MRKGGNSPVKIGEGRDKCLYLYIVNIVNFTQGFEAFPYNDFNYIYCDLIGNCIFPCCFLFVIYNVYNDYINLKKSIDYQECRTVPITEPLLTGILFLYLWIVFLLFLQLSIT